MPQDKEQSLSVAASQVWLLRAHGRPKGKASDTSSDRGFGLLDVLASVWSRTTQCLGLLNCTARARVLELYRSVAICWSLAFATVGFGVGTGNLQEALVVVLLS